MQFLFRIVFLLILAGSGSLRAQQAETPPEPAQPAENEHFEVARPLPGQEVIRLDKRRMTRRHHTSARTVFGNDIVVRTNESVHELIVIGGRADIQGTVEGSLVVIGGNAEITGNVENDVVVVGGALKGSGSIDGQAVVAMGGVDVKPSLKIGRGSVFIGGPFNVPSEVSIMGERVMVPLGNVLPKVEAFKDWFIHGLLFGRLLPFSVPWAWMVAGFFVALYFVSMLVFPAGAKAVFVALEERPVTSMISGLLTLILFAPLAVLLVLSVVGVVVVPFLKLTLILALIFGKVGVMCFLGRSFGRSSGLTMLQAPLLAFLIGAVVLLLAYTIPVFGVFAWGMATVFGLGGAVVAIARRFNREDSAVPPAAVPVATLRPAARPAVSTVAPGLIDPHVPPPIPGAAPLNPADTVMLARAGFWLRLLAGLLDLILLILITGAVSALFGRIGARLFVPIFVAYFVGFWTWRGTTVGSLVMGLKIVRSNGSPVTFSVALVRCLSSFFSALVLFLGFFWAGWDRDKQAWHDKIAGTIVVKVPKGLTLV